MSTSYRYLPLSAPKGCDASAVGILSEAAEDRRFEVGLHFVYCHAGQLKPDKGAEILGPLNKLVGTNKENRDWDRSTWQPETNSVIVLDTTPVKDLPKQAVTAFGKLRGALYEVELFKDKPALVLCHPVLLDLSAYPDLVSHFDCDGYCLGSMTFSVENFVCLHNNRP